jgi:hypothetical protein
MPRSPAAASAFTVTPKTRPALKPPPDLNALEREEFANIVLGVEANHFLPCDTALVAHLAQHIVLARVAFGELRAAGYVSGDRPSPWLPVLAYAAKEMRATARALSLTPASYRPTPKPEEDLEVSYYEKMSLLEARPDDDAN